MKISLLAVTLISMSSSAIAETWSIDVSASYVNSQNQEVQDAHILSFEVPAGKCVNGESNAVGQQEICILKKDSSTTVGQGGVFADGKLDKYSFEGNTYEMNLGQPVFFEFSGSAVEHVISDSESTYKFKVTKI